MMPHITHTSHGAQQLDIVTRNSGFRKVEMLAFDTLLGGGAA